MKLAVASHNFTHVSGHAGQARCWLLFDVDQNRTIRQYGTLELTKEQTFHHHKVSTPEPFIGVSVVISTSAGDGFARRLQKRGITVVLTSERDPLQAVRDYVEQSVKPPKPRPIASIFCKLRDRFSAHEQQT
jgi:predicted Fe-Mo cluster-binding NifX family protein